MSVCNFIHNCNTSRSSLISPIFYSILSNWSFRRLTLLSPWRHTSVLQIRMSLTSKIRKHETISPNGAGSFVQIARSANIPVVLDAGGADTPISQELLKCVTVLRLNEAELARLTGMETSNLDQITVAAMSIHQLVCFIPWYSNYIYLQFRLVFRLYSSYSKEQNIPKTHFNAMPSS